MSLETMLQQNNDLLAQHNSLLSQLLQNWPAPQNSAVAAPPAQPAPIKQQTVTVQENAKPAEVVAVEAPKSPLTVAHSVKPVATATSPVTQPVAPGDLVTQIRDLLTIAIGNGQGGSAQEIIQSYGVTRLSDIPQEHLSGVLGKAKIIAGVA